MESRSRLRLGVPAYEYPGRNLWRELTTLPSGSIVIIDPADGPGISVDPRYVAAISSVRARKISLLAYVTTAYGERDAAEMIREVKDYIRWYGPDGIFFDQTPVASTSNTAIAATFEFVRSRGMAVAINPGQPDIDPRDAEACDHIVNFEGPLMTYERTRFPVWTRDIPSDKFWHLVYDVHGLPSLKAVLDRAASQHAGTVFVTDATMPNPWGTVPEYWQDELRMLGGEIRDQHVTTPSTLR